MELFREEYLTIQDDYLRVDPSREESDNDVDVSNDELGENTEVTPLGDAIEDDDITDYKIDPDDEDDLDEEDDLDVDLDTEEEIEEDDDIVDFASIDPDDEEDFDEEDDLLDEDDDLDAITPDLDEEDDFIEDEDDDLLDEEDDTVARTSINPDFSSRSHGRVTGTMLDHEPGLSGSN